MVDSFFMIISFQPICGRGSFCTLSFSTDYGGHAVIDLFNALGRKVKRVLDADLPPGNHTVTWDTRDASGNRAASGIYLYRLQVGEESSTKKMVLIR